ncbi:5-oxoprolinase subunit PxpB [Evansella sp. AB-rgal1]|uniref:5-oxoprolinase subunit PxpB n=1 Tax=Evansella sp. AB-rgal1 TaxID=3242696 RepID=UPI00359E9629
MNSVIKPLGDQGIRVELGNVISPLINQRVHQLVEAVESSKWNGVFEAVPAYTTVTVYYNPLIISYELLKKRLREKAQQLLSSVAIKRRKVILPVFYGGDFGPDLEYIAKHHSISEEDVIRFHTEPNYITYMIGFSPGFPYLGGMVDKLTTPRKKNPRAMVKAGSVGIAGSQTGVYSVDSPGGWQIIGRTPVPLFQPKEETPTLFKAGDLITFQSISKKEFEEISLQCKNGTYEAAVL